MGWTPELVITLVGLPAVGAAITKIVDAVLAGLRDARRAHDRPEGDCDRARMETAYYVQAIRDLRERCLAAGMSMTDLGPFVPYQPPDD